MFKLTKAESSDSNTNKNANEHSWAKPLPQADLATVSGGCSNPLGCTQLYQARAVGSFSFAMLGGDVSAPTGTAYIPNDWPL